MPRIESRGWSTRPAVRAFFIWTIIFISYIFSSRATHYRRCTKNGACRETRAAAGQLKDRTVLCIVHSHEREHRHRGADFAMHNDGGVSPKMSRMRFKEFSTEVYPAAIP